MLGVSSGQDYFSVNAATGLVTVRQQLTSDPARPTFYQVKSTKTSIWPKNLVTHHVSHARIGGGGSRGSRPPFLQNSNFLKYKVNNYRKYAQTPTATRSNIDRNPPPRACFYKMFAKIRPLKMRISTFNFAVIAIHSKKCVFACFKKLNSILCIFILSWFFKAACTSHK